MFEANLFQVLDFLVVVNTIAEVCSLRQVVGMYISSKICHASFL